MHAESRQLVQQALRAPLAVASLRPAELDLLLRLLRRVRLLGFVAARLEGAGRLDDLADVAAMQLRSAMVVAEARARLARWELDRIARALGRDLPHPLIAMKGCAYLLAGLPNLAGRVFADVDLMMPRTDIAAVEQRLLASGWQGVEITPYDDRYYRVWAHELPPLSHPEREVEVDLHHNLLMSTARAKPDAALLLQAARPVPGTRYHVLAPADMCLHAMAHLFYGDMADSLRELVDIHVLLEHYGEHEPDFWVQFRERARQLDLSRVAFYGLRYSSQIMATRIPSSLMLQARRSAPPAPFLWLMDRLVPRALFPPHPGLRAPKLARLLMYMRSHWLRMPPLLLARHLLYKASRRHEPA